MTEVTVNDAPITIPTGPASIATTITRGSASTGWPGDSNGPASADFRCVLNAGPYLEVVMVTGGQGTTSLTVTRAYELIQGVQTAYDFSGGSCTMEPVATSGYLAGLGGGGGTDVPIGDPTGITTGSTVLALSADAVAWTEFPANTSAMAFGLAGDSFPRVVFDGSGDIYFGDGTVDPTANPLTASAFLHNSVLGVLQLSGSGGCALSDTGTAGGGVFIASSSGPVQLWAGNGLSFNDDSTTGISITESGSGPITINPGGGIFISSLPTSDPLVAGQLWNSSGVLMVSAG